MTLSSVDLTGSTLGIDSGSITLTSNGTAAEWQASLTQIDSATQRNSAAAEETAVSAELLADQARGLHEVLGGFRLTTRTDDPDQAGLADAA